MREGVLFLIVIITLSGSCKKESIADYIPYSKDTINNPIGFLEDYGDPYAAQIGSDFFKGNKWKVTVSAESLPNVVFNIYDTQTNTYGLKASSESTPNNYYDVYCSSYNDPYHPDSQFAMEFVIGNGDSKLSGKWYRFGNSERLILAKHKVTLVFTRR